jgi:predicted transcriptional regulator
MTGKPTVTVLSSEHEQLTAEGKSYSYASNYIESTEHELKNWEKGLEEIQNGTFEYDDSMPKQCVDAMYEDKVKVCRAVLDYLNSLDKDTILSDNVSLTEAGSRFYEMINSSYEKLQEKGFIKDTGNTNEKIELNNEVEEEFEM